MAMMTVRLVRNTVRRTEVDTTRHRLAGGVVHNNRLHPVATVLHDRHANLVRVDLTFEHVTPAHGVQGRVAKLDLDRGRGDCRDLGVHGTARRVVLLAPAGVRVIQELIWRAPRKLIRVAGDAAVDHDLQICRARLERTVRALRILEINPDGHGAVADERLFVGQAEGDRGHNKAWTHWDDLDRLDGYVRGRVFPAPQVITARPALGRLGLPVAGRRPRAVPAVLQSVLLIGTGQERQLPPGGQIADLEPFAYGNSVLTAIGQVERIGGDSLADWATVH